MNLWKNRNFTPMLLEEISKPFDNENYIYEPKFDGIRALIFVNNHEIKIQSRNNKDLTYLFPELNTIKNVTNSNVIFDGEIVLFEGSKPSFSKLLQRNRLKKTIKIKEASLNNPVTFIAFDIIYENKNLTNISLIKRKDILNKYPDNDVFIKIKYIKKEGIKLFKKIKTLNLEGIVAKNINSNYYINTRTNDFIKIKNYQRDSFFIIGYNEKENILTLILGNIKNNKIQYAGKVIINKRNNLYKKIKGKKIIKKYIDEKIEGNFIKPDLKCNIKYLEKTENGHLRHAVYEGEA